MARPQQGAATRHHSTDITSPETDWAALGDGYRIDARIVVYEAENVLKIPTGALFRDGEQWAVYVDADGIARKRLVTLSRRTGLEAAVASGLNPGDRVILFASDAISDGVRVVGWVNLSPETGISHIGAQSQITPPVSTCRPEADSS